MMHGTGNDLLGYCTFVKLFLSFVNYFLSFKFFLKMANDFGAASFMLTSHRNLSLLLYESQTEEGRFRLFRKNRQKRLANGIISEQYVCRSCDEFNGVRCYVTVHSVNEQRRIKSNPDNGHNPQCTTYDKITIETLRLKRDILKSAENGVTPKEAYRRGIAQIPDKFDDVESQDNLRRAMPSFKKFRSSAYR